MAESSVQQLFDLIREVKTDIGEIKGMCKEREKRLCRLEGGGCEAGVPKWCAYTIICLITILASVMGVTLPKFIH